MQGRELLAARARLTEWLVVILMVGGCSGMQGSSSSTGATVSSTGTTVSSTGATVSSTGTTVGSTGTTVGSTGTTVGSTGTTVSSTSTATGSNSVSGVITTTPSSGPASAPATVLTLQGAPLPSATVGAHYSFQPTVSPSGAGVKFAISGQPAWITFDTSTGALGGTPMAADEGTTGHIVVTASIGSSSTSLTPFTIQVHPVVTVTPPSPTVSAALSWTAPTENADGSPVSDLAGYRIYYGTNIADLTSEVDVSGAQSTTYVLKGLLTNARYYFAVVAFNSLGLDSGYSDLVNAAL